MKNTEWSTVSEITEGLRKKEYTAVELAQYLLQRIEALGRLNAFITVSGDVALEQARSADARLAAGERGPLLGVPIAIKDAIITKGVRTTCASRMLEDFIPPYNATVIEKLNTAGTVMVGKTSMDEFAMGSSNENAAFGPVKNPWDEGRVPGGSSGGSAAAVAAGLAPAALGSDTGGSVRLPAAFCGIVGLKPTYGRISRYGLVAFASSLDQIGLMTRSVEDCALLADHLFGKDPKDATSAEKPPGNFTEHLSRPLQGLRIGLPKEYFVEGVQPEVKEAVHEAVRTIESMGAEVVDVSLPHSEYALATYYIVATAEASSNLARYDGVRYGLRASDAHDLLEMYSRTRAQGFGAEVKRRIMMGTYVLSSGYYDAYYLKAQKVRTLLKRDFDQAFEKCDVILSPTAPSTAFRFGEKTTDPLEMYLSDIFTVTANLVGIPGMSIPCGFDSQGLPIGLQLLSRAWNEETLLSVAYHYETASAWHRRHPQLSSDAVPLSNSGGSEPTRCARAT